MAMSRRPAGLGRNLEELTWPDLATHTQPSDLSRRGGCHRIVLCKYVDGQHQDRLGWLRPTAEKRSPYPVETT